MTGSMEEIALRFSLDSYMALSGPPCCFLNVAITLAPSHRHFLAHSVLPSLFSLSLSHFCKPHSTAQSARTPTPRANQPTATKTPSSPFFLCFCGVVSPFPLSCVRVRSKSAKTVKARQNQGTIIIASHIRFSHGSHRSTNKQRKREERGGYKHHH